MSGNSSNNFLIQIFAPMSNSFRRPLQRKGKQIHVNMKTVLPPPLTTTYDYDPKS